MKAAGDVAAAALVVVLVSATVVVAAPRSLWGRTDCDDTVCVVDVFVVVVFVVGLALSVAASGTVALEAPDAAVAAPDGVAPNVGGSDTLLRLAQVLGSTPYRMTNDQQHCVGLII